MGNVKESSYYDSIYSSDEKYSTHYEQSKYFPLYKRILWELMKIDNPIILEIGCGTGQFASLLYDRGFGSYRGFDFSQKAITKAQKASPQKFFVGNAYNISNYTGEYNTIISLETLEHLADDLSVLKMFRKGSNVIISVPTFDDPSHVRFFTNMDDIIVRYSDYMDIHNIVPIQAWFIVTGVARG